MHERKKSANPECGLHLFKKIIDGNWRISLLWCMRLIGMEKSGMGSYPGNNGFRELSHAGAVAYFKENGLIPLPDKTGNVHRFIDIFVVINAGYMESKQVEEICSVS